MSRSNLKPAVYYHENSYETEGQYDVVVDDYNESCSSYSDELSDDGIDPAWASAANTKGEVFFVEPASRAEQEAARLQSALLLDDSSLASEAKDHKQSPNKRTNGHTNGTNVPSRPTGDIVNVLIDVDPEKRNYGRRASLCEALFGIVPSRFRLSGAYVGGENGESFLVMVGGLLPDGQAAKSHNVRMGDWLMKINDHDITSANVDSVLAKIKGAKQTVKVKLTLQRLSSVAPEASGSILQRAAVTGEAETLVRAVSGWALEEKGLEEELKSAAGQYAVMYLTLVSSDSAGARDDIVYQYPKGSSSLVTVRGMFITLSDMLNKLSGSPARSSTVEVDGERLRVGYVQEDEQVMVLIVPAARVSSEQLEIFVQDSVRLLRLLHCDLRSAFTDSSQHGRLDHFFWLQFQRALNRLQDSPSSENEGMTAFDGPRLLNLSEDSRLTLDMCLSEFEAADFADMSEDFYGLRRSYVVLGTSLFYQGYLLASHLGVEDTRDVELYLRSYGLLMLSEQQLLGQVVVWKEIYLTRRHQCPEPPVFGYSEPDTRCFLLVVGYKHSFLAVLLEAGGCATRATGHPTPDPFYVDQAKATLLHLESQDLHGMAEERLGMAACPALVSADSAFSSRPTRDTQKGGSSPASKKAPLPDSVLKKRTPNRQNSSGDMRGFHDSDADSQYSGGRHRKPSAGSEGSIDSYGSGNVVRTGRRSRILPSAYDSAITRRSPSVSEDCPVTTITAGGENYLLHVVSVERDRGVVICPTQRDTAKLEGGAHSAVLQHFTRSCRVIRRSLAARHSNASGEEKREASSGEGSKHPPSHPHNAVLEEGTLFHCPSPAAVEGKKGPAPLAYWVVGRLMVEPERREVYVCFQDSVHQNAVEMAFRLGFGTAL